MTPRPASAYRTASELVAFGGASRVNFSATPMRFRMVSDSPLGINPLDLELAAKRAVETWNQPACVAPPLSFDGATVSTAQPGDNLNTIQWVLDWEARQFPPNQAATTDVQYLKRGSAEWQIVEADIYLNAKFTWSALTEVTAGADLPGAPKDVQAVLTHELGHTAGLLHPCEIVATAEVPACSAENDGVCMNPVYSVTQRSLSADDISGICFLYPAASCDVAGCPEGEACSNGACALQCGGVVCTDEEVCSDQGCIPIGPCSGSSCVGHPCEADTDCALREFCSSKTCALGKSALGDPCTKRGDCRDGACVSGSCTASCASAADCPGGTECDGNLGICQESLKAFGDACSSPTECRGGACLVEDMAAPVCTRPCGESFPACPYDWVCRTAEGTPVCAPLHAESRGGCNIAAPNAASESQPTGWLFALALGSIFTRRVSSPGKAFRKVTGKS